MAGGILGASPGDIQALLLRDQTQRANVLAQGGHRAAGAVLGDVLGGAFAGEDPRLTQAKELDAISKELAGMGLEPGMPKFRQELVRRVQARIGTEAALNANRMALEAEQNEMAARVARSAPAAIAAELKRRGLTPDLAFAPKIAEKVIQGSIDANKATALVKNLQAFGVDPASPEGQKMGLEILRKSNVTINNIPAKVAEKVAIQEGTAAAGRGRMAKDVSNAVEGVRTAANRIDVTKLLSSPREQAANVQAYENQLGRLAKALAQIRNPPNTEASAQAEERILARLPSAAALAINPGALDRIIEDIVLEAQQAAGSQPAGAQASGVTTSALSDDELAAEIKRLEAELSQ